jgi:hypothetical protein
MAQRSHFAPLPTTARHPPEKLGDFETLAFRIIGNRLVLDQDGPLARFKAGGAGDGEAGELGLAPIPQGGLLAIDAQHVYRRTTAGWGSVPPPAGNPSFTDVASGPNGPTWLTSEGWGHLLTGYDCH